MALVWQDKNLVKSDVVDRELPVWGDESPLLYRIVQMWNQYFEFHTYFLGGKQLTINLWIAPQSPLWKYFPKDSGLCQSGKKPPWMRAANYIRGKIAPIISYSPRNTGTRKYTGNCARTWCRARILPKMAIRRFVSYLKGKSMLMVFEHHASLKYKLGRERFCRLVSMCARRG